MKITLNANRHVLPAMPGGLVCALCGCFCFPCSLSEKKPPKNQKTLLLFTVIGGDPSSFPPSLLLGTDQKAGSPESCPFFPLRLHRGAECRTPAPLSRRCWGLGRQQQGFSGPRCSTPRSLGFLRLPGLLQLLSLSSCGRDAAPGGASLLPAPRFLLLSRPEPASAGQGPAPQPLGHSSRSLLSPRKSPEFFLRGKEISADIYETLFS